MTARELQALIEAEPFRPFRIHMASGRTFDIRHPEMIRVGRTSATVFIYTQEDQRFYEHVELLGLLLMEFVSLIETPVTSAGN
jgi:hypothetical protein